MNNTENICNKIQAELFLLKDEQYKASNKKLIPNIQEEVMIGIRMPVLRKFAKIFFKQHPEDAKLFMQILPHRYFEENNLHAFFIECIKDIEQAVQAAETFLPFIDNWETCDVFSPPVFKKHPELMYRHIQNWLKSQHCYTVRYAIGLLLTNYLDEEFKPEMLELAANIASSEYYVNMIRAWYFCTALIKQYESAIPYIEQKRLEIFTHNKTIQKAIESRMIPPEKKAYLKTLKIR